MLTFQRSKHLGGSQPWSTGQVRRLMLRGCEFKSQRQRLDKYFFILMCCVVKSLYSLTLIKNRSFSCLKAQHSFLALKFKCMLNSFDALQYKPVFMLVKSVKYLPSLKCVIQLSNYLTDATLGTMIPTYSCLE